MVKPIGYTFVIIFFSAAMVWLQEQEQITQSQSELNKIKSEISRLEQELKLKIARERETFAAVDNYNKQSFLLNKAILNLKSQEEQKHTEIKLLRKDIAELEAKASELQKNYSRYIVAEYKYGKLNNLAYIFDSESVKQAALRIKYLSKFSERREKDLKEFRESKAKLVESKNRMEQEEKAQKRLVLQKTAEEKNLQSLLSERKKLIKVLHNDKKALTEELEARRNAEIQIKNLITSLIEEAERKRKEEAERIAKLEAERLENKAKENKVIKKTENILAAADAEPKPNPVPENYDIDLSTANMSSFSALRGKLNWPVRGKIIRKYGENRNRALNTVTLNYGVDISAAGDLTVRSVADGVVSAIDWIPGYGSVIIITHKGDYRTVYSHLAEILVKEGDRVKSGSALAKVGESIEGKIVHFEIWSSRTNQNPELWLSKK